MRRILFFFFAMMPIVFAAPVLAGDHGPRFDPVANLDGRLVNPYGQGFRGREGQGMSSGLYRAGVIDGPAVFRSSEYPFLPRRTHLGNALQSVRILHRRWP